jgi:uncharacterized protein (DUF1330 family)
MAAYVIADTDVHDPEGYEEYKALARPIAEKYGGEYLARGGELQVVDAQLWSPTRLVVIRFPDMASAKAFAESDEYAPVAELRHRYATSTVVIVDGG